MPVGILTYANIVIARAGFMRDAAEAGADSLLIADVPALEAERFTREMAQAGIEPVLIAAANTPEPTLRRIASAVEGLHLLRQPRRDHRHPRRRPVRRGADRPRSTQAGAPPPIFGFGISTPEHVRAALAAGARGVICGSAIVDLAARGGDVAAFVRTLKDATRNESPPQ